MEFSGLLFLYGILPLTVIAYYMIPDTAIKNWFLIGPSLLLFGLCQPLYIPLLLLMIRYNFKAAQKIKKGNRTTLLLPVVCNLLVIILLKYLDSILLYAGIGTATGGVLLGLVSKMVTVLNKAGFTLQTPVSLVPLGYSFFVLASLSYLVDVYRGKIAAEKKYGNYLLYMTFFPKFFQGPIVRYDQMRSQLKQRGENYRNAFGGIVRFCTGLGKKVLLADYCGRMIAVLAASKSDQALVGSWLAAVLFMFRIYYDFSGCCDMAVGLGRMFGFRLPENFHMPFAALSVTEFFERWNITLASFFRDYVTMPLCGKHPDKLRRFLAMLCSFALMGLWHGAGLTFLIWGVYIMVLISAEEYFEEFLTDLPYWLRRMLTMLAVLLGWVIFMHPDIHVLGNALKAMIGNGGLNIRGDGGRLWDSIPILTACCIGVSSLPRQLRIRWRNACGLTGKKDAAEQQNIMTYVYLASCFVYVVLILWWCTVSRTGADLLPSIFMNL